MIRHLMSLSGGIASAFAANRLILRFGAESVRLLFADTMYEDPDLYRFLDDIQPVLGVPIIKIADGRNPWQVFKDEKVLGRSGLDPCSRLLKRELLDKWAKENAPVAIRYLGIWPDESHRLKRLQERRPDVQWDSPLMWRPLAYPRLAEAWLIESGVKRSRQYDLRFPHDNCGGRCVKQGQVQWAHLLRVHRDRYLECENNEESLRAQLGDVSMLSVDRKGVRKNLTLKVLRQQIESTGTLFDPTDCKSGCGCAVDIEEDEQ